MMLRLETVVTRVRGVAPADLQDWVARGWIAPAGEPPEILLAEADLPRVELVRDLRDELGIAEDTLPVVLSLLDQVAGLRHALQRLTDALAELPPETRSELLARIRR